MLTTEKSGSFLSSAWKICSDVDVGLKCSDGNAHVEKRFSDKNAQEQIKTQIEIMS